MDNRTVQVLPLLSCILLDFPESRISCSDTNSSICYKCMFWGRSVTGESIDDYWSAGHIITLLSGIMTTLVGICGVLGNLLIIYVFRKQNRGTAFDCMLIALAWVDTFACIACAYAVNSAVIYFGE